MKKLIGAKHVLNRNDMSGMVRWETCSPPVVGIIETFEECKETISNLLLMSKKYLPSWTLNPLNKKSYKMSNTSTTYDVEVHSS